MDPSFLQKVQFLYILDLFPPCTPRPWNSKEQGKLNKSGSTWFGPGPNQVVLIKQGFFLGGFVCFLPRPSPDEMHTERTSQRNKQIQYALCCGRSHRYKGPPLLPGRWGIISATIHYLETDQTLSSRSLKRCLVCSLLPKIQMKIRPWGTAEKKAAFPILPQPLSCGWELGQLCFAFLNLYLCICICTVNMQWM